MILDLEIMSRLIKFHNMNIFYGTGSNLFFEGLFLASIMPITFFVLNAKLW